MVKEIRKIAKQIIQELKNEIYKVSIIRLVLLHFIYLYLDVYIIQSFAIKACFDNCFVKYVSIISALAVLVVAIKVRGTIWCQIKIALNDHSCEIIIFFVLGLLSSFIFDTNQIYKSVIYGLFIIAALVGCICIKYKTMYEKTNLYDLIDIINLDEEKIIKNVVISEKAVSYDLLNRQVIVRGLFDSIINNNSGFGHVIGLKGSWGCGKTTIINLLKSQLKASVGEKGGLIIIDRFEPWIYGNQEAFLGGLLDEIETNLGIRISYLTRIKIYDELRSEIIEGSTVLRYIYIIFGKILFGETDIKRKISDYLLLNNRKLLVIIDNLDRADANNIILMFKLLGTTLDINNITYIVAYDEQRMSEILENSEKINSKYIEKIISQEFFVPLVDKGVFHEIVETSFNKLLKIYDIYQSGSYTEVLGYIVERCPDLRQYKRYINSVFPTVVSNEMKLYQRDLVAIETIKFFDYDLYEYIRTNGSVFLDSGFRADYFGNSRETEDRAKLMEYLGMGIAVMRLLETLFPNIHVKVNNDLYLYAVENKDDIQRNSRICDSEVFDLYFSYSKNEYYEKKSSVENFIQQINLYGMSENELNYEIKRQIKNKTVIHNNWFELLRLYMGQIKPSDRFKISLAIISALSQDKSLKIYEDAFPKSVLRASLMLLDNSIECESIDKLNEWCNCASCKYDFSILKETLDWCEGYKDENADFVEKLENFVKKYAINIWTAIVKYDVNIYSDKYYVHRNVLFITMIVGKENYDKNFVRRCINKDTVYNFLRDVTNYSIRSYGNAKTSYEYFLDSEQVELLVGEIDLAGSIENTEPKDEVELMLKDLYNNRAVGDYRIKLDYYLKL